ncbi:phage portal protein [Bradyrhizobium sp. CCBAU 53351]|uniref:phage portal protein n=1 Tax=Bradyrhizobium sp. CCBAU 53351 TaxID=1325114 RepID=UPI0018896095|nr:phage portal protein [Bradyrhizobium sp. CCBAU 53351]QOZ76726.1 phage portal protein [Bradyrhizobium sp. CCBAU 53351]
MSLTSRLKQLIGLETKSGISSPEPWLVEMFGASPTLSGVTVSPYSAMSCAPVACAVRSISEAAGSLPLHIYRKLDDGGKEKAPEHPLYALLHDAPNTFSPAALFRTQLMADALLQPHGGFALINRVDGGKPAELIRLDPRTNPVAVDDSDVEPTYKLDGREIAGTDLIHLPTPAYDPRKGLVGEGREAIALALVLERHAARLFGKGARPSGVLTAKGNATQEALTKVATAWNAAHGGNKSGGTAILPGDFNWQALTLNSVDAQFLEMRTYAVAEIARLWRVPLHMLMQVDRAQPRSIEAIGQEFLSQALLPRLKSFEQELELKLLPPEERKQYCIEFNVDGFARADLLARAQALSATVSARILNPNEARQLGFGYPAYEGGDIFENPNTSSAHQGGKLNGNAQAEAA